ncbi:MAG: hypothetical protein Q8K69_16965, partial [Bacteroidota bacterium]|nr:hypothetical protein [Bacteroidota bacterium]
LSQTIPFSKLRQFQIRETTVKQFYAGFQWNIIPVKINFAVRGCDYPSTAKFYNSPVSSVMYRLNIRFPVFITSSPVKVALADPLLL